MASANVASLHSCAFLATGELDDGSQVDSNLRLLGITNPVPTANEALKLNNDGARMGVMSCGGTLAFGLESTCAPRCLTC